MPHPREDDYQDTLWESQYRSTIWLKEMSSNRGHFDDTLVICSLMNKSKVMVCDRTTQGCGNGQTKNHYHKWESIPCRLLSRQVGGLLAFEASGIEPMSLAFKASVISTAPVVLHWCYTTLVEGLKCEWEAG